MTKIVLILISSFVLAKQPVSLQPETKVPDVTKKDEVDLNKFKDVELKKKNEPSAIKGVCTSRAGVQSTVGMESYESCMRESERYTPPGYNPYKKNK